MAGLRLCSDGIVCNGLWQACDSGSIYVCASTASITQQSVNRTTSQPASQPGRQAGSRPGPDRVKQQAGKQNEPQWQCKQTTARPHHNHTASCHLQSCIWLCAGRERKEEGRKSSKEKEKSYKKKTKEEEWWQEGQVWWQCQRMKEEKWSRKGRSKSQGGRTTGGELARGMKCC